ncbi:uncharacterized protein LOC114882391 [Osmia bicornis bicornis]|uniref:uncharacterized protein LOC114882391 n=1 Tax=Osmia bicornis bicornis TaxID=1437191 RepID=UPI001EAE97B2|nr:uncharacterized protein LOC114882391 [Osmia bicornis bicornis]
MDNKKKRVNTYGAGGVGTLSTGPKGGEPAGLPGSSSDDCGAQEVEHQATVQKLMSGEKPEKPEKSRNLRSATDVETWFSSRLKKETFGGSGEIRSMQPPEELDKTLMDELDDISTYTIDDSLIETTPVNMEHESVVEEKIDLFISTMNSLVRSLVEVSTIVLNIDKKVLRPSATTAIQKMDTCVGKMADVMDQLSVARKADKRLRRKVVQSERAKDEVGKEGLGRGVAKETQTSPGMEFPPLPLNTGNKRKEISPVLAKEGKKTKRVEAPASLGPRIRRVETVNTGITEVEGNRDSRAVEWELVKRRKKRPMPGTPNLVPDTPTFGTPVNDKNNMKGTIKRKRIKPQAIAIRFEAGTSFSEILKRVKRTAGPSPEGIKGVRQTRAGNLLLEFSPNADVEAFKKTIEGKLGTEVTISKLQERTDLEIRGIDPDVEGEEILSAVCAEVKCPENEIRLKILRTDPRRNKVAVVEGPAAALNTLIDKGKIKVGWTIANVREIPRILRCFKCHALGHVAAACKRFPAPDFVLCRRCGAVGHSLRECKEEPRCRLCLEKGASVDNVNHVAASVKCPIYKEAVRWGIAKPTWW